MPIAVRSKGARTSTDLPDDQSGGTLRLRRAARSETTAGRRDRGGRRQPRLVLVGLALVLTCAAVGGELARKGVRLTRYLVLSQSVPAGAIVDEADLQSVDLSSPGGIDAIPVADASQVVGRRVAETVVAGSLLVVGDLLGGASPSTGNALVGTSLQPNEVPSSLQPGDDVLVVASSATGSSASSSTTPVTPSGSPTPAAVIGSTPILLGRGTVFALNGEGSSTTGNTPNSSTGVETVTISVPAASAAVIAAASAAGDVSLVEVPPSSARPQAATR
jgi:hypothetical protein